MEVNLRTMSVSGMTCQKGVFGGLLLDEVLAFDHFLVYFTRVIYLLVAFTVAVVLLKSVGTPVVLTLSWNDDDG